VVADRGVHISAHVPTGYLKNPKGGPNPGRLEPDPKIAPIIAEAFRMRATGTPYTKSRPSWNNTAPHLGQATRTGQSAA
jgi:hypothetical protein